MLIYKTCKNLNIININNKMINQVIVGIYVYCL